jgi:hypothetical protein
MLGPTHDGLVRAERQLRRYDKALRLRFSLEGPKVLLERKVRRGRIGALLQGEPYAPDAGTRVELGHVNVGAIPFDKFDGRNLLDALKQADSWKLPRPLWYYEEARDADTEARKKRRRTEMVRYRTEELWNKYVWKYKQRVSVPVQVA